MNLSSVAAPVIEKIEALGIAEKVSSLSNKLAGFLGMSSDIVGGKIPEEYAAYTGGLKLAITIILALLCIVVAFYSAKIFKVVIMLGGALAFGGIGSLAATYLVTNMPSLGLPESLPAIAGLVAAVIGLLVSYAIFSLAIFVVGAGATAVVTFQVVTVFVPVESLPKQLLITAVAALIGGILMVVFFKLIFILLTSFGGMGAAGLLIATCLVPNNPMLMLAVIAVFLVAGLFAMGYQFKHSTI